MREPSLVNLELVEAIKIRLAEGLIASAREDDQLIILCRRLLEESFQGQERELAVAWLKSEVDSRENVQLLIRFTGNPPMPIQRELAAVGFVWSNLAKGWTGQGSFQSMHERFAPKGATVLRI